MNFSLMALLAIGVIACACENEGRSDEARETVTRYLAAVASDSGDHGWQLLTAADRESLERDEYEALAQAAAGSEMVPEAIGLLYEDDGFYQFAVTFTEPISPDHAALFALENEFGNRLACMPEPTVVELVVIIHPLSGPGISINEC